MPETTTFTWDDVRRFTDQLELKIHLAGMEARDRWHALQPKVTELEQDLTRSGKHMSEVVEREVTRLGGMLRKLLDEIAPKDPTDS
ncbi:MAG: hypothetical protein K8W52_41180 [Deltaproteobacteria bacterium]|nr:hypothetical protein [Deltaproteobacteria bacterium]